MISNKTAATLLFITLNMQLASSSSNDTPGSSSSDQPAPLKRRAPKPKTDKNVIVLRDTADNVKPVGVEETDPSQGQLVLQVNKFEELFKQGEYEEIFKLGTDMNKDVFLKQLCPLVKTHEQYKGLVSYLKQYKLVAPFYLHGDIVVVREAILADPRIFRSHTIYNNGSDLEKALHLAFQDNHHDRIIDLFNVRNEISVEKEKTSWSKGVDFRRFVATFLEELCSGNIYDSIKRFLTLRGDELNEKHPELFATICKSLVCSLRLSINNSSAKEFLTDLVGQSSLLTPPQFAWEFLVMAKDTERTHLITYGWREAIREGLREEYLNKDKWLYGGKLLWPVMRNMYPGRFPEMLPSTEEELAAALEHFPTKKEKEEEWIKKRAPGLLEKLDELAALDILPKDVWNIFIEYAKPTWLDV